MRTRTATKKLTVCAILAALSLVLLYMASVLPTSRLALIAVAGLLPALAVVAHGLGWGMACFGVTALLSLLILPTKAPALIYCLFFGHYPVAKSLFERLHRRWLEWTAKLVWFNLLLTAAWLLLRGIFLQVLPAETVAAAVIYGAGNAAFVLYDFCFSALIQWADKLVKKIR